MKKSDIPFWNPMYSYDEQDDDVKQFWMEEARKLEKGLTVNGVYIHPWLYWHLNFWKMMIDDGDRRIPGNSHLRDNEWFFAEILKKAEEENKGIFMFGTRRFGKALLNSELLYGEDREIRIGDALVGDRIYNEEGKLVEITGVYPQGAVRTYRISFADGRDAICCGEHLWRVYTNGNWTILSTNSIIKKGWKNMTIQLPKAVNYPTRKLPINPNTYGSIIASYLSGSSGDYLLNKQSTKTYIRSSPSQKWQFLESFIKGMKGIVTGEERITVSRVNEEVIAFVLRMFWSYGWYASFDYKKKELFVSEIVNEVEITNIEVYGKYNATCITVDSRTSLFLTTNYLVTHNSAIMSSFLARNATMSYNLSHNVIGSSKEDLASIAEYLEFGLDNLPPFLKINRTGNNWEKEVIMGNRLMSGERDVHARIRIINVESTKVGSASLKTAGSTPYTSIYDEVGKYPFLGAYLAGRPSHMMHGKMRGMILAAGCVCAGTKVYKADGSPCLIEDLKQEDGILGYDAETGKVVQEGITWMNSPSYKRCCRIHLRDRYLECSLDHPIYVLKDGVWGFVEAGSLFPGCKVGMVPPSNMAGHPSVGEIKAMEYLGVSKIYNLTTSRTHTYLANDIITHNTGGNVEKSQDAQKVMNNPSKYHFIVMDYDLLNKHAPNPTWRICQSGCFVPGQMSHAYEKIKTNLGEYLGKPKSTYLKKIPMEVTDFDASTKTIKDRLSELADGDRELYVQEKMAYPLTIDDCFLNTNVNRFPIEDAVKHKNELLEIGRPGKLVDIYKKAGNQMGWEYSDKPLAQYPFKGGNIDSPVIMYEDPPADGGVFDFTYVSGCLLPGTIVLTNNGWKPIEESILDSYYDKDGKMVEGYCWMAFDKVNTDIYDIHISNTYRSVKYTKEHPIYVSRIGGVKEEDDMSFDFVEAKDVRVGDWVRFPNIYRNEVLPTSTSKMSCYKNSADFWWLVGLWIGDGHTGKVNKDVVITVGDKEDYILDRIKEVVSKEIGCDYHICKGVGCCQFSIKSNNLKIWLEKTFGVKSTGKHIPEWVKRIPYLYKSAFIHGYLDSDGCICNAGKDCIVTELSSVNLRLLEDIQHILFSMGIVSRVSKIRDAQEMMIGKRKVQAKECYHLRMGRWDTHLLNSFIRMGYTGYDRKLDIKWKSVVPKPKRRGCFISKDGQYIYFKIKSIEKSKYTGKVYNLTDTTHSYLVMNCSISNCDPFKQEKADTDSIGAFYVFKRAVNINDPYANRIVASYCSRPTSSDIFCRNCEILIESYGAKCLMENADRLFELYLARQGKDQYLLEDGEMLANRIIRPGAKQNNRLGLSPTPINQRMLFSAVLQYCWEDVVVDIDQFGHEVTQKGIYRIDDIELLEEIIAFGHGVNTDRIIAFGHALLLARYYDDMNYMPESSTQKQNRLIREYAKRRQADIGGFVVNKTNKGFASRKDYLIH